MKKFLALVMVLISALGLAGCSEKTNPPEGTRKTEPYEETKKPESHEGTKPYERLTAEDIASAKVEFSSDQTIPIRNLTELAELLSKVILYKEDDSYKEYCGQSNVFILTLADGRETKIEEFSPFLIIDGVGYQAEYSACEALCAFAREVQYTASILDSPPCLQIVCGEDTAPVFQSDFCWSVKKDDGTWKGWCACCPHPLEWEDSLIPFETTEMTAVLDFSAEPDSITVRCWSDKYWGNTDAENEEVAIEENTIALKSGGYIYKIFAKWETEAIKAM